MTLDEAIQHCEEVAEEKDKSVELYKAVKATEGLITKCESCAKEHRQLAEWLKNYKRLLEQEPCGKGINVPATDAINRQAVNALVDELARAISDERCFISRGRSTATIMQDILDLPPVTPQYTEAEIQKMQELEQAEIQKAYELGKAEQPCEDAISRQTVIDAVFESCKNFNNEFDQGFFVDKIRDLSPVQPQPKVGRWIDDKCSVCGKGTEDFISSREWYRNKEPNFCPFCGIKIKSEDKE